MILDVHVCGYVPGVSRYGDNPIQSSVMSIQSKFDKRIH